MGKNKTKQLHSEDVNKNTQKLEETKRLPKGSYKQNPKGAKLTAKLRIYFLISMKTGEIYGIDKDQSFIVEEIEEALSLLDMMGI